MLAIHFLTLQYSNISEFLKSQTGGIQDIIQTFLFIFPKVFTQIQSLGKIIYYFAIRPAGTNLGDLLRQLSQAATGRARLSVEVEAQGQADLPTEVKIALYRIAQEALNNVIKHAAAERAVLTLYGDRDGVELCIADDGSGFDPTAVPPGHLGLGIMRERAQTIGATLEVESMARRGTRVTVTWKRGTSDEII